MSKRKRKLTAADADKAEKRCRRKEYMTIFINGKQKRVERPPTIDRMDVDEFIRRNADPIWLVQNEMWEYLDVEESLDPSVMDNYPADVAERKQSQLGGCEVCGARIGKTAMAGHLRKCLTTEPGTAGSATLLIRAQATGSPTYWLDCVVKEDATLKDLDHLLRRTWVECCEHLSAFYLGAHSKVGMSRRVWDVLPSSGSRIRYEYDFGSTTELVVSSSGILPAVLGKPIQVVARNEPPVWPCDVCGDAATDVCPQCSYDGAGFCCSAHAEEHDCDAGMLPVVNSPRMGVCGYSG